MRIAQVVCTFPPYRGGMGNVANKYAEFLSSSGHDVAVFTPDYKKNKYSNDKKFKVFRIKAILKFGNGAFIPGLFFKLKNYDIVYLHYPFFGGAEVVWLAKLLFRNKFKLIIHYHMDVIGLPTIARILSLPSRLIRNSLFNMANKISCASIDYIEHSNIGGYYRKNRDKFCEIPFGVDVDRFKKVQEGDKGLKKENRGRINILFVGGLDKAHYFKGVDILLKALSKLRVTSYKLRMVGDGDMRAQYAEHTKKLGIGDRVSFVGGVDNNELIKQYQGADIFVLPSINRHEAFGLVLLEAMSCSVPVIASNLPGVRSVFRDGVQGLLVEPGDVDDLVNKIKYLLENKKARREMGPAGRKLVLEKFSIGKEKERLLEVFVG